MAALDPRTVHDGERRTDCDARRHPIASRPA